MTTKTKNAGTTTEVRWSNDEVVVKMLASKDSAEMIVGPKGFLSGRLGTIRVDSLGIVEFNDFKMGYASTKVYVFIAQSLLNECSKQAALSVLYTLREELVRRDKIDGDRAMQVSMQIVPFPLEGIQPVSVYASWKSSIVELDKAIRALKQ